MGMNSIELFRRTCLCAAATLPFAGVAVAQTAPDVPSGQSTHPAAQYAELQSVTVTATRIVRKNFVAPTPMTTITMQDLQAPGYTNLGAALADIPSSLGDSVPQTDSTHSNLGQSQADLRGLGPSRTLVLIDGMRPVFQGAQAFDLNTIPISLVKRVDVVTGGASAAWGSDAVAGVVNVVLDNDFVGAKADLQYGNNWQGYGSNEMASFALGTHFGADDRGHFMVAGQWNDNAGITAGDIPRMNDFFIGNPNASQPGQPTYLLVPNYNYNNVSLGGLITAVNNRKNGGAALIGTAFGPGGVPYAFNYGAYNGLSGPYMSGGGPEAQGAQYFSGESVVAPDKRYSLYSRGSYDFTSSFTLTADFLYSNNWAEGNLIPPSTDSPVSPPPGGFTISNTNAFLPAAIAAEMAADNVSSFTLGRSDADFGGVDGTINSTQRTQSYWGALSGRGSLAHGWSYNLFYDYGESDVAGILGPTPIVPLLSESINSVMSGGQPVCASTALTNPLTGATCVPVNLFGYGSPSAAALNFFEANAETWSTIQQNEAGGEVQGEPFSTWAGPVSVAGGFEWRTEAFNETVDALSAAHKFALFNQTPLGGRYRVGEGFFETVVPLLANLPAAKEFDFNGAVRETHYSEFGYVTSWKVGATDKVTNEFLLRGTYSQDIRAPNITELFTAESFGQLRLFDPAHGNAIAIVSTLSGGNPELKPELARTMTYGIVYSPERVPLNLSVDWWRIDMWDGIATLPAQDLVDDCYEGITVACADVVRDSSGNLSAVYTHNSNLAGLEADGLDVEVASQLQLSHLWHVLPGALTSHLLLTYNDKYNETLGTATESVIGYSALRWKALLTETYTLGRFSGYLRGRYLNGSIVSQAEGIATNYNYVPDQYYLDAGVSLFLLHNRKYQVYANVTNLLNRQPPLFPEPQFYDMFGRTYNVGVRLQF